MTLAGELVFEARVSVAPPLELGETPRGRRRVIHITGGTVSGPLLSGTIIPGGADCRSSGPTA